MNKQGNAKLRHLERYKCGESKFSSLEESRQLRAIKKKEEQKYKRDAILTKIRGALSDTPQTGGGQFSVQQSQTLSTKKLSKDELKELGIKRYQEMLRWKEGKRKILEREKKARKPAFKTGLVKPDPPQFLQDAYLDKKDQTTPFKFSVVGRDSGRKSSLLSSVSKENVNTLNRKSSRALSFHTGITPQTSSRGCRRTNRVFRPPPEYGITPLPKTPGLVTMKGISKSPRLRPPTRSSLILKESKSFAPNNFNFQAPKGLQKYSIRDSSTSHSVHASRKRREENEFCKEVELEDVRNIEVSSENLDTDESEGKNLRETYLIDNYEKENKIDGVLFDKETSDSEVKLPNDEVLRVKETSNTAKNIEDIIKSIDTSFEEEIGLNLKVLKSHKPEIGKEELEIECSNVHFDSHQIVKGFDHESMELDEKNNINILPLEKLKNSSKKEEITEVPFKENSEQVALKEDIVIDEEEEISAESDSNKENLEQTAKRNENKENISNTNTRIKFSGKKNLSNFTPPLERLRPRTPCSRSTRRSRLAHCDTPCFHYNRRSMTTPVSGRRKSKRSSKVKTEKLSEFVGNYAVKSDSINDPPYETSPQNVEDHVPIRKALSQQRIHHLENNPWITRSRGSSSSKSCKRKDKFDSMSGEKDIGYGAASPQLKTAVSLTACHETTTNSPLEEKIGLPVEFFQQQTERDPEYVADMCVWGPESVSSSPTVAVEYSEDSSSANVKHKLKSAKKKRITGKRVSLLTDHEAEEDVPSIKYPVTPKTRSFSSTGTQRVSLLPGLYPREEKQEESNTFIHEDVDLISFSSPAVASPRRRRGRPSKSRIKVLTGLTPHSEEGDKKSSRIEDIDETSDLLVWDSPKASSSRKKSNVDTPLRRSKRLSKI